MLGKIHQPPVEQRVDCGQLPGEQRLAVQWQQVDAVNIPDPFKEILSRQTIRTRYDIVACPGPVCNRGYDCRSLLGADYIHSSARRDRAPEPTILKQVVGALIDFRLEVEQ